MLQYTLICRQLLGTTGISLHLAKSLKGASVMNSLPLAFLSIEMSVLGVLLWTAHVGIASTEMMTDYLEWDYVMWKNKPKQISGLLMLMPQDSCALKHKHVISQIYLSRIKNKSSFEPKQFGSELVQWRFVPLFPSFMCGKPGKRESKR